MMEIFSMVGIGGAIPEMAIDLPLSSGLMAVVAMLFAVAAVAVFHIYRERLETPTPGRRAAHLKVVQRPAFGAAH